MKLACISMLGNTVVLVRERDNTIIANNLQVGENVQKDYRGKMINVNWELAEKEANNYGYTLFDPYMTNDEKQTIIEKLNTNNNSMK